uniref:hypothetical protein n=1 Tax=Haloprofundus sp. MHR1 TaxID=2572921 RepID=UPI001F1B0AD9|nr:hypothetical protein [Haloprofundus sp. MHR1]
MDHTQDDAVDVGLINSGNASYTFEVWVGERPLEGIQRHSQNNETEPIPIVTGLNTIILDDVQPPVTFVSFPNSTRQVEQITLTPDDTREFSVEDMPSDPVIVITVRNDERIFAIVTATCSGDFRYVEVTSLDERTSSAYNC